MSITFLRLVSGAGAANGICGQMSQASPAPSKSPSTWVGLATSGQLSHSFARPSPSRSMFGPGVKGQRSSGQRLGKPGLPKPSRSVSVQGSHASPMPSPSVSSWLGLKTNGQLSQIPTPSRSGTSPSGKTGHAFTNDSSASTSSVAGASPIAPAGRKMGGQGGNGGMGPPRTSAAERGQAAIDGEVGVIEKSTVPPAG